MKIKHNKYIMCAALALLSSCSDDDVTPVYSVGEADNAIVLRAGVADGKAAMTRAGDHIYSPFSAQTQMRLRVDGTWLGKYPSTDIQKVTTATAVKDPTTNSDTDSELDTHEVKFSAAEQLYWDDYGTADPNNMDPHDGNGRTKGLTIYGVAVNGKSLPSTLPKTINWESIDWTVGTPSSANVIDQETSGWENYDLLTSNNVTELTADGTYKFEDREAGKLLKFTHAMTKISVKLTAGKGFPGWGELTLNDGKFEEAPTVTLFKMNYIGTVNVISEESEASAGTADFKMHDITTGGSAGKHEAVFDALVFPGNSWTEATKGADLLTLTADGNTYKITAEQLYNSLPLDDPEDITDKTKSLKRGVNYIINITVDKTEIKELSATIIDWEDQLAANEQPVINLHSVYGHPIDDNTFKAFTQKFDFLRSTAKGNSYGDLTEVTHSTVDGKHQYEFSPKRFWPDHSTHYFFRGIWPQLVTEGDGPKITQAVIDEDTHNVIAVENVAYAENTFPSDLMLAMPRNADGTPDETCKEGHTEDDGTTPKEGICSTESSLAGGIHMNFMYVMSQVEVKLSTSTGADMVNFDEHTTVVITDCFPAGNILLSDGSAQTTGEAGDYGMHMVGTTGLDFCDAIVPQSLTNDTKDLKFVVTIKNGNDTFDRYETVNGIKSINVKDGTDPLTNVWEPGKKYVYELYITKTDIKVDVTITDWVTVNGYTEIVM